MEGLLAAEPPVATEAEEDTMAPPAFTVDETESELTIRCGVPGLSPEELDVGVLCIDVWGALATFNLMQMWQGLHCVAIYISCIASVTVCACIEWG